MSAETAPGGFNYSSALLALKRGERVARAGWNGKGMWLALVPKATATLAPLPPLFGGRSQPVREVELAPFLVMRTADGKFVPWLCSQSDALADDWQNVTDNPGVY